MVRSFFSPIFMKGKSFCDFSFASQCKKTPLKRVLVYSLSVDCNWDEWMDGWLAILHPYQQYFSHIKMMLDDNERLEPRLRLGRFPSQLGLQPKTARSVGQRLTYWATGASQTVFEMRGKNDSCKLTCPESLHTILTLLHSERPELYAILAFLSAIG